MAKKLELLSPARNVDIGIEAINCGADAVYIGAPAYGARCAATNRRRAPPCGKIHASGRSPAVSRQ